MTINEYIHQQRTARGWSLNDLAERAGLAKSYIHNLENNPTNPGLDVLQKIAKAFDMGAGDMLVEAGYTVAAMHIPLIANVINKTAFELEKRGNWVYLTALGVKGRFDVFISVKGGDFYLSIDDKDDAPIIQRALSYTLDKAIETADMLISAKMNEREVQTHAE